MTEEQQLLLRVVLESDRKSFETLVELHQAGAVAFAENILHDHFSAEDAVQDALAEFYFRRSQFRGQSSFKTYLYAIIRHKCADRLRKRHPTAAPLETEPTVPSPEDDWEMRESCEEAFALMRTLPEQQLHMLWQHAVQGLSYREIATQTGHSEVQIRVNVHRARKAMRRMRREQYGS